MSGAPRVAARAELRKRGIKGSSVRCSRLGCCFEALVRAVLVCSDAFSCCTGLYTVAAAVHCARVSLAVQCLQPACCTRLGVVTVPLALSWPSMRSCACAVRASACSSPRFARVDAALASGCKTLALGLCAKKRVPPRLPRKRRQRCAEAFPTTTHSPSALRQPKAAHESCRRTVRDRSKKDSEPCLAS